MKKATLKLLALALCAGILMAMLTACDGGTTGGIDRDEYNRILEENRDISEQLGYLKGINDQLSASDTSDKTTIQRWEYMAFEAYLGNGRSYSYYTDMLVSSEELLETANKLGEEGWELVSSSSGEYHQVILYFKRPLQ